MANLFFFFPAVFIFLASAAFAEDIVSPKEIVTKALAEIRLTKNFTSQFKRVDEFDCKSELKGLEKYYLKQRRFLLQSENILDTEKRGQVSFRSLPPAERKKLAPLFPPTLGGFIGQLNKKSIAGDRLPLLLSIMMRETDFDMFLDEDTNADIYIGPHTRKGAGLVQMTAWNLENQAPSKWGAHDFQKYSKERLTEVFGAGGYMLRGPRTADEFRSDWLPMYVDVDVQKDDMRTAKQFVLSPYNPLAAFWYGNKTLQDSKAQLAKEGITNLAPENEAPIVGLFYNAGMGRVRCAVERIKVWNSYPDAGSKLSSNSWDSLRGMIYLDRDALLKSGMPAEFVGKLEKACSNRSDACSCLDQEKPTRTAALKGNDFKGAVSLSYGDHMRKLYACFSGYVSENEVNFHPDLPAECRQAPKYPN